jgi:hypothetical protein
MGTISDKLMRIINTKEDIRQALISKGYDVPTSIPFKEYAKMILDLPCRVDSFPDIEGIVARYSALGLTNEQMAENPIWKDLTGNGHDLQMKNFAWKGMSGVGGYTENYDSNKWYKVASRIDATWTYKSFNVKSIKDNNFAQLFYQSQSSDTGFRVLSCTIKVSGLTDGQGIEYISNGTQPTVIMRIENDGIYHLPSFDFGAKNAYYGFRFLKLQESCNITIEQLPLYPGALVFDGVDDYGTCDNFPILTKEKGYTVVALRQYLVDKSTAYLTANGDSISNTSFILEGNNYRDTWSFGKATTIQASRILATQTSKQYDGVKLNIGTNTEGSNLLQVGKWSKSYSNVAIWELVFLDHDATEEELTKIKDYFVKTYPWLFPDQAWTVTGKTNEDEDRATIANITGNGNNLVLSNFGFAGNSGYGEYAYNWNEWGLSKGVATNVSKQYNKFVAVMPVNQSVSACSLYSSEVSIGTRFQFKLKITGLTTNWVVRVMERYTEGSNIIYEFDKDGTYQIDHTMTGSGNQLRLYIRIYCDVPNAEGSTVAVEQIPEYEGYLVTDGVDDSGRAANLTISKDFTMVGEWVLFSETSENAGISIHPHIHIFNRPDAIQIMFRGAGKTLPVKSLKAICSDGRCYDENWSELKINVGKFTDSRGTFYVANNGTNFSQTAFKNLGIYNDQLFSKDDCIKAYNYLQTLKAK